MPLRYASPPSNLDDRSGVHVGRSDAPVRPVVGRPAIQGPGGRICIQNMPLGIDDENAVRDGLQDGSEAGFVGLELSRLLSDLQREPAPLDTVPHRPGEGRRIDVRLGQKVIGVRRERPPLPAPDWSRR